MTSVHGNQRERHSGRKSIGEFWSKNIFTRSYDSLVSELYDVALACDGTCSDPV